jgi:hypothetical protein
MDITEQLRGAWFPRGGRTPATCTGEKQNGSRESKAAKLGRMLGMCDTHIIGGHGRSTRVDGRHPSSSSLSIYHSVQAIAFVIFRGGQGRAGSSPLGTHGLRGARPARR